MGAAAAGAHAAMANAIKASGVIVKVEPTDFFTILKKVETPLVVTGRSTFRKHHQYLTSYRGLAFFTTSSTELVLPPRTEVIRAKSISFPEA